MLEAMVVGVPLPVGQQRLGPIVQHDNVLLEIGREDVQVGILALVVVEKEAVDANQPVELDPLGEIGSLVAVDGADRQIGVHREISPPRLYQGNVYRPARSPDNQIGIRLTANPALPKAPPAAASRPTEPLVVPIPRKCVARGPYGAGQWRD